MSKFYMVSLDPAQLHDYSAVAVIENSGGVYHLVSLNRKRQLPYTEIVAWAKKVFLNPKFQPNLIEKTYSPAFLLDVGGVGRAILDMLTAEGIKPIGIQLTAGDSESHEGDTYHVSKSHVIGKFLAKWDEGKVLMPSNASFLEIFQTELRAFRGEMSSQGRARFEAEQGSHDDLIMSVAQAIWWAVTRPKQPRLAYYGPTLAQKVSMQNNIRPPGTQAPPHGNHRPGFTYPPGSSRFF